MLGRPLLFSSLLMLFLFLLLLKLNFLHPKTYYPLVEEKQAKVNNYYIYGQHFNIEGTLDCIPNINDIEVISLVLKNETIEIYLTTLYEIIDNKLDFKLALEINNGLNLDYLHLGHYFLLLKIHYQDEQVYYYSLSNQSPFRNLDYYTMSVNNYTNHITIDFLQPSIKKNQLSFLQIKVIKEKTPHYIYDIIIDPGHGGEDTGASINNIHESAIVLAISLGIKKELEKSGFRVKLTREDDYNPGGVGIDSYYPEGRVNMPYLVKAKYLFSIHLNSAPYQMTKGGIEIYCPFNANLDLARSLATNIVKYAKTRYSPNNQNKKENGLYVRTFTAKEIEEAKQDALKYNYLPYDITTNTPYHYIIRELGGKITNAYVDGRNKRYHKNNYYNFNIGVESYLIELGFMVNNYDLANMVHNKKGYILGITEGIKAYFK